MKKIIILFFTALLFNSCLKDEIPFQYIVQVNIFDEQNQSIEADIITLKHLKSGESNYLYTYDNTRRYYEFLNLESPGEYQIWVQKNGNVYRPNQKNITLNENKVISVNIKLEKY